MFAAAAIVAQTVWLSLVETAKWIATKVLVITLLAIFLPWVLKGVFLWGFDFLFNYAKDFGAAINNYIMDYISQAGYGAFEVHLSSIGGYLAVNTGLIDYCSIVITGWGIAWVVSLGLRSLGAVPGVRL